jgi:hypothetical protein
MNKGFICLIIFLLFIEGLFFLFDCLFGVVGCLCSYGLVVSFFSFVGCFFGCCSLFYVWRGGTMKDFRDALFFGKLQFFWTSVLSVFICAGFVHSTYFWTRWVYVNSKSQQHHDDVAAINFFYFALSGVFSTLIAVIIQTFSTVYLLQFPAKCHDDDDDIDMMRML